MQQPDTTRNEVTSDVLHLNQNIINEEEILEIKIPEHYEGKVSSVEILIVARCIAQKPEEGVRWDKIWEVSGLDTDQVDACVQILDNNKLVTGADPAQTPFGRKDETFYPLYGR